MTRHEPSPTTTLDPIDRAGTEPIPPTPIVPDPTAPDPTDPVPAPPIPIPPDPTVPDPAVPEPPEAHQPSPRPHLRFRPSVTFCHSPSLPRG